MEPARSSATALTLRAKAFALIKERSFAIGDFTLASGQKSKFYLDMKPTMFHPEGAGLLAELVLQKLENVAVDCIGGLEMGAVPLVTAVALVSQQKGRPLEGFFVRKQVKDHGTRRRVEAIKDLRGKNVVILEDVTTTGGSAMAAVEAVEQEGGKVAMVLTIVDRGAGAKEFYAAKNLRFEWLFRLDEFLAA
jgi:orotate phosphoribosyltransferase